MLRKIASLVKPIMRNRSWHVGTFSEFYPEQQQNLLGMNTGKGIRIDVRLRYPSDKTLFLPLEEVVDTMLHELSHNVFGPHDAKFHKLWDELREEYEALVMKGYTGEGFLGDGHKLGGRRVPMTEMRRQARVEAERRKTLQGLAAGSGQKLGGRAVLRGVDMRKVIADAVDRRGKVTRGCGAGTKEGDQAGAEASRDGVKTHNGFKSKVEEDEANQKAINEALWELVQDEEDRKAGVEPEVWIQSKPPPSRATPPPVPTSSKPSKSSKPPMSAPIVPTAAGNKIKPPPNYADRDYNVLRPRQTSRLVSEDEQRRRISGHVDLTSDDLTSSGSSNSESGIPQIPRKPSSRAANTSAKPTSLSHRPIVSQPPIKEEAITPQLASRPLANQTWTCEICTLVNPVLFLACDACGVERSSFPTAELYTAPPPPPQSTSTSRPPQRRDLGSSDGTASSRRSTSGEQTLRGWRHAEGSTPQANIKVEPLGWNCVRCGSFMERQWWTCSACGTMKTTS